jgi:uncharacterized membrane protein (Fun14 family)
MPSVASRFSMYMSNISSATVHLLLALSALTYRQNAFKSDSE